MLYEIESLQAFQAIKNVLGQWPETYVPFVKTP